MGLGLIMRVCCCVFLERKETYNKILFSSFLLGFYGCHFDLVKLIETIFAIWNKKPILFLDFRLHEEIIRIL